MAYMDELIERIRAANVEELSGVSGVSTKTIYRLRNHVPHAKRHMPNMATVDRLVEALDQIEHRAIA